MFGFKKNKELHRKIEEYFSILHETMDSFRDSIEYLFENSVNKKFKMKCKMVRRCESNADDLRRQIEIEMFKKSLLPESRGDLLAILEQLDNIPNTMETILDTFVIQKTELISETHKHIDLLLDLSEETVEYTIEAVRDCFSDMQKINELNRLVDNNESMGDKLERKMLSKIFSSKLDGGEKVIQKEIILMFGDICDICEKVLDLVVISSVKRKI